MKTAKQREEAFRVELAELLERHGATLELTEETKDWHTIPHMTVFMDGVWAVTGDQVKEYAEFNI